MAIINDGIKYLNLEEQVQKNKDDISYILNTATALNQFGITVVDVVANVSDMPTVAEYKAAHTNWKYGETYAVGTSSPYELYVLTRANTSHATDYWFDIGNFPKPGPQGAKGDTGDTGAKGDTGETGNGISSISKTGTVGLVDTYTITYTDGTSSTYNVTNGAKGDQGEQGLPGEDGEQGPQGPQGEPGPTYTAGSGITITDNAISYDPAVLVNQTALQQGLATRMALGAVAGTNDETNWTTITIDGVTKNIPSGGGGGGRSLYKHTLYVNTNTSTFFYLYIISLDSNALNLSNFGAYLPYVLSAYFENASQYSEPVQVAMETCDYDEFEGVYNVYANYTTNSIRLTVIYNDTVEEL